MGRVTSTLHHVFRNVILTPLTAGNLVQANNPHHTDGSLSSIVVAAFFTSVTFTLIGIYQGRISPSEQSASHSLLTVSMCLTTIATFFVILISVLAYKKKDEWQDTVVDRSGNTLNLKVKFLWLFGFGVMFSTAVDISINIECLGQDYENAIPLAAGHFSYIVYSCLQLCFITYFINFKFGNTVWINYGILVVLLTNLILWFSSLVYHGNEKVDINNNTASLTPEDICYWNSTIQVIRQSLLPYLNPVHIEFSLLGAGFILSMWAPFRNDDNYNGLHNNPGYNRLSELSPLIQRDANDDVRLDGSHPASYYLALIGGIAINISLVTIVVLEHYVTKNDDSFAYALVAISCVYKGAMLLMAVYISRYFCKYTGRMESQRSLSASECILIFAYSGVAAWGTFSFIAGIFTSPVARYFFLFEKVLDVLAAFTQTIMIVKSSRLYIQRRREAHASAEYVCFLLAVSNFTLWCIESFVMTVVIPKALDNNSIFNYRTWGKMQQIIFPFIIFYRFHSFIDLFEIRRKLMHGEEGKSE